MKYNLWCVTNMPQYKYNNMNKIIFSTACIVNSSICMLLSVYLLITSLGAFITPVIPELKMEFLQGVLHVVLGVAVMFTGYITATRVDDIMRPNK